MPEIQLRLGLRPESPRTADAWYLASGDVHDWLAEIATWSTQHAAVTIVPLSHEGRGLEPAGAIDSTGRRRHSIAALRPVFATRFGSVCARRRRRCAAAGAR